MHAWIRQHCYALKITLRRIVAQPFSSLFNCLIMALALTLPLLGYAILFSLQPITQTLSVSPEITLYLKIDAPAGRTQEIAEQIRTQHNDRISHIQIITRHQALNTLKQSPTWAPALSVLPDNPLPDAIVVSLKQSDTLSQQASNLAQLWQQWPEVDFVQMDSDWIQRLDTLLHVTKIGLGFLAICVITVVLITIFNTVRIQALAQKEEIAVVRLVGATETFVRRPFLYLGALLGSISAVFSVGLTKFLLNLLNHSLFTLAHSYGGEFAIHLPGILIIIFNIFLVATVGALCAYWSVNRNTRF